MICRECKQDLPEIKFWEVRIGRNQHVRHITNHSNLPLDPKLFVGRYLSKMKLASFREYLFEDSDFLNKIDEEREREIMKRRGFNV